MTTPLTTIGSRTIRINTLDPGDEVMLTTKDHFRFTFRVEHPLFSEVRVLRTEQLLPGRSGLRFLPLNRGKHCYVSPDVLLRLRCDMSLRYTVDIGTKACFDFVTASADGLPRELVLAPITSIVIRHRSDPEVDEDADTGQFITKTPSR